MRILKTIVAATFVITLLIGCGGQSSNKESNTENQSDLTGEKAANNSTSKETTSDITSKPSAELPTSSSAAVEKKGETRKFIRTADLKFRVKSVLHSTYDIEDITNRQDGFVTYTNLVSNIDNVTTTAINADSSLETTFFTVSNSIVLRVPNTKLDTTLKEIARNIDYLDYRIIKADDVGLEMFSNNLAQQRSRRSEDRLANAIDNKGRRLDQITDAEDILSNRQEQSDDARIANLSLNDKVKFSTVSISLYQRQSIKREVITNYKNIEAFEPGFGSKILDSLKSGWYVVETIIVFLLEIWWFILFAVAGFVLYKKFEKKLKKDKGTNVN